MILLNDHEVTPTLFPDGTSQVWKIPGEWFNKHSAITINTITWDFSYERELMPVLQLKNLLDKECPRASKHLDMPYLPYARQDKEIDNSLTFSLHTFATVINAFKFDLVMSVDVHSPVASELIHNLRSRQPLTEIRKTIAACEPHCIYFPDKGANNRYAGLIERPMDEVLIGNKVRNQQTGEIIGLSVKWGDDKPATNLGDLDILMLDDICDGGMTFIKAADELKTYGARELYLYVSHGIFSKGLKPLRDAGISRIFTKDGEIK